MIYICADDYGLCDEASFHIQECIDKGALNKVSIFPNFQKVDIKKILENKDIMLSLHLNLVEGRCMANKDEINLLVLENGNFKNTFVGLFKLCLFSGQKLKNQLYKEIKAQVLYWKSVLPANTPFCIDSHQHTHMIPVVFKTLLKVLRDEKIDIDYMRIPVEPLSPYIKTPSLYFTYSAVNIVKQWLLNFLWFFNKNNIKKFNIPTAYFFGILFSGKMDNERVSKILPKYIKKAEKKGMDIEVLFHPGYLEKSKKHFGLNNIVFKNFYLSNNRKTEFDSVMNIKERSVR